MNESLNKLDDVIRNNTDVQKNDKALSVLRCSVCRSDALNVRDVVEFLMCEIRTR